jgi:nucleoid-associated protein YgaU
MGLFSFIKGAGAKLFGKKEEEAPEEQKAVLRASVLLAHVQGLALPFKSLTVGVKEGVVTLTGAVEKQEDAEKIVLAVGNVDGVDSVDNQLEVAVDPNAGSQFHTVVSGDTLSKISKEFYGDAMKYNVIFEANQPMLSHPDKIYPGQLLRIPALVGKFFI